MLYDFADKDILKHKTNAFNDYVLHAYTPRK